MIVLDASIAVKWYLTEVGSDDARAMFARHAGNIIVPDMFLAEVVGAMVRRGNINKAERPAAEAVISRFLSLIDEGFVAPVRMSGSQMQAASKLALDLGHPLKDCIYLALAMDLGCPLVTADAKFAAKAKGVWEPVELSETS